MGYPEELHDSHDNFTLTLRRICSAHTRNNWQMTIEVKFGGEKLCLTLDDKKNYISHYRNLKLYLEMGLEIRKVRRMLKFKQSSWLNCYIDLNTKLRQASDNKFEENFAKLMNNSFFGKNCEDVWKYKDVKIAMTEKRVRKLTARPTVQQ